MKKIILFSLFASNVIAQSVVIRPNKVESQQNAAIDNITLQSTNQPNILAKRQNGTIAVPTAVTNNDDLLSLQAAGYNGTAFSAVRGSIRFEATQNWNATDNGTRIKFFTTANGTTSQLNRLTIDNTGKIGIGVANPTAKLHIEHDGTDSDPHLRIHTTSSYSRIAWSTNTNANLWTAQSYLESASAASNYWRLEYGVSTKLYLSGDGNLGVGSNLPRAKLDVDGDIILGVEDNNSSNVNFNSLNRNGKSVIKLTGTGALNLRGIGGGVAGMIVYIYNYNGSNLTIFHDDPAAPVGDRIWTLNSGANIVFTARGSATFIYDGANQIWRVMSYNN
jgi:hypothetical protein